MVGLSTVIRTASRGALAALLLSAPVAAQVVEDIAEDFCLRVENTAAAREICVVEFRQSAIRYRDYAIDTGYIRQDGSYNDQKVYDHLFSWRGLLGLPTGEPINHCTMKYAYQPEGLDFRAVWQCIRELDPDAARRDRI